MAAMAPKPAPREVADRVWRAVTDSMHGPRSTPGLADLNPEAGRHPVPRDPEVMAAALRASARMLDLYPYLELRFGERGRRFTDSDSAWLATLPSYPLPQVRMQVAWLGRLLASRGLPRLLLERHLGILAGELGGADGIRSEDRSKLIVAADILAERRRTWIDDRRMSAISGAFEGALGPGCHPCRPGMGDLIAGAVADEADGLVGTAASLLGWLTDPRRFPADWISASEDALAMARRLVSDRRGPGA